MQPNRRHFLFTAAGFAACSRKLATPYNGYAYIASKGARAVSVVNLSRFKLSKEIPLDAEPTAVLAGKSRAYVLTPESGTIVEIDAEAGAIVRKHRVAAKAISMRLAPDGASIWLLAREPQALVQLDLKSQRIARTVKLAQPASDFDLNTARPLAAIDSPASLINLDTGRTERHLAIEDGCTPIRFRPDGKQVLAAHAAARLIGIADVDTGRLIVKLPMPLEPQHFCFTLDNGGQLFVTGRGMDAVVIVSPYQTSIGETILAGHAPGDMAVDAENLYLTNPDTGYLTVISIADRMLRAKIAVGQDPAQVMITPGSEYALVINRQSSDLSVIRVSQIAAADTRFKRAPLFTVVPLGAEPVSGAVCSL